MANPASEGPETTTPPTAPLYLRFHGGCRHGQVIAVEGNKLWIGAGEQCNVRLRATCLAPVHCLVVRGTMRTLVRRWAEDTRLNGLPFETSPLAPGDVLGVGPVDLEILPGPPPEVDRPADLARPNIPATGAQGEDQGSPGTETDRTRELAALRECAALREQLSALEEQREEEQNSQTAASARSAEAARALADEMEVVSSQRDALRLHADALEAEVVALRERCAAAETAAARESERAQAQAGLAEQWHAELMALRDAQERSSLERHEMQARLEVLQAERDELEQLLATVRDQAGQGTRAPISNFGPLDRMREPWESTAEETGGEHAQAGTTDSPQREESPREDPFGRLESLSTLLDEAQSDVHPARDPISSMAGHSHEDPAQSEYSQVDWNAMHSWDTSGSGKGAGAWEDSHAGQTWWQSDQSPSREGEDELSIQEYMAQLLRRTKRSSVVQDEPAETKQTATRVALEGARTAAPEGTAPNAEGRRGDGNDSPERPPRHAKIAQKRPPRREQAEDRLAMRELADLSVRQALGTFSSRRGAAVARENLLYAGIAAALMLVVYYFLSGVARAIAQGACALAALFLAGRTAYLYQRSHRLVRDPLGQYPASQAAKKVPRAIKAGALGTSSPKGAAEGLPVRPSCRKTPS